MSAPTSTRASAQAWADLRAALERSQQQAQDAAHVILENGLGAKDLRRCGCDQCKRVFEGMREAEFVSGEWVP